MVNEIPPDHVDDVPVVKPNQHDDVPIIPEPVLVDEDEDPEEDEFEEEEDPQEEEDDMEVDIEEDKNEPDLPYEEVDPLNPPPPASESEPEDAIEVETVPASVHETTRALVEKKGKAKDEYYGKLILDLGNEVLSSVEQRTAIMEKLVEKLGNAEDKVECKKLKKELEKARHENVGNDARGSGPARGHDAAPAARECTFAGFMKCNPTVFHEDKKVKFAAATLQGPALTWWNSKIATIEEIQRMEHELWNLKVKEYNIVAYTQRFNELALMYLRMVEPKRVKVDAYIWGLTDNIKGEVTSSKPANLNGVVRMAHKLMD
ncbi:hypothetical protein Tco_0261425 [Tanacetum coccineum]